MAADSLRRGPAVGKFFFMTDGLPPVWSSIVVAGLKCTYADTLDQKNRNRKRPPRDATVTGSCRGAVTSLAWLNLAFSLPPLTIDPPQNYTSCHLDSTISTTFCSGLTDHPTDLFHPRLCGGPSTDSAHLFVSKSSAQWLPSMGVYLQQTLLLFGLSHEIAPQPSVRVHKSQEYPYEVSMRLTVGGR